MRAGFAQVDVTCPSGTPLGGNAREDKTARGVHDPLHATVAALGPDAVSGSGEDQEGSEVLLVSFDLVKVPAWFVSAVRAVVVGACGVDPCRVMVSATHTHSGPDVDHGSGFDRHDYAAVDAWADSVLPLVGQAARSAVAAMVPARMTVGRSRVEGLGFNRRLGMSDGTTRMNWEGVDPSYVEAPLGPVDPEMLALAWWDGNGRALGVIVHYTLHPAVLVGLDWLVSADFPGPLRDTVREMVAEVPVLFLNGALGNVNHLDYRATGRATGFEETERIGTALGRGVADAMQSATDPLAPELRLDSFTVLLRQRTVDRVQLEQARALVQRSQERPVSALDGIPPVAYARWMVARGRQLPPTVDVPVDIVTLGPVVLVLVPFEVFVEFQLRLRRWFPDRVIVVVSLSNGSLGYLPTREAFSQGGYEPTFGTSVIEAGQGEELFTEVRNRLESASASVAAEKA